MRPEAAAAVLLAACYGPDLGHPPPTDPACARKLLDGAGDFFMCAIMGDGTVRCWGQGSYGQLGDGSMTSRETPEAVIGITDAVDGQRGAFHACVRNRDGRLWCWGANAQLQAVGVDSDATFPLPTRVTTETDVEVIGLGDEHTCITRAGPVTTCWGRNDSGQSGDATLTPSVGPTDVGALGSLRLTGGDDHTCGWEGEGEVLCWGSDAEGQRLGDADPAPRKIDGVGRVRRLSAGLDHTCALLRAEPQVVTCWGDDSYGQTGGGLNAGLVRLTFDHPVVDLSAGENHTCALDEAQQVWCWGRDDWGQLGRGGLGEQSATPVRAVVLDGVVQGTILELAAMHSANCVRNGRGQVWCWGRNDAGQAGVSSATTTVAPPTEVLLGCPP